MTGLRKTLGLATAACAAATLLAGAALAGNPHGSTPPGHQGTPPGQAKKGTTGNQGTHGRGNASHGKALGKSKHQASQNAHPAHPFTPPAASVSHGQSASHKPAFAATKGKGHEKTAQHKVIICHRTGSSTNPYVVINISINAWLNGHSKHPALDGRSDILLKDPAAPGEKLPASMCPQAAQQQQAAPAPAQSATPPQTASPLPRPALAAAGGVKGASSSLPKAAAQAPRAGGVLGAFSAPVTRAQLPFTGLSLWPVALAAAVLVLGGALLRRRAHSA